jgi:replicative DNA helicase
MADESWSVTGRPVRTFSATTAVRRTLPQLWPADVAEEKSASARPAQYPSEPETPNSLAAEKVVLGALIEDGVLLDAALDAGLSVQDFFSQAHREIFKAILRLRAKKYPIDYLSAAEALGNKPFDFAILSDLVGGVVIHRDHILHHVLTVRNKARLRRLLLLAEWINTAARENGADPDALVGEIQERLKLA